MARWLVACETSGRVRDALRTLGHDAVSCDLLPTVRPELFGMLETGICAAIDGSAFVLD